MGLVHVRTGSRRAEFEGERKSSERLLQARERLGLAHRGVVAVREWRDPSSAWRGDAPAFLERREPSSPSLGGCMVSEKVSRPGGDLTVQGELTAWWASEGFAAPRRAVWSKLTQIEKQSRAFVSRAPARLNRGRGSAGDFAKH